MDPVWVIVAATAPLLCFGIVFDAVRNRATRKRRAPGLIEFADARDLDFDGGCVYGELDGVYVRIDFPAILNEHERRIAGPFTRFRARIEAPLEVRAWVFRDRQVFNRVAPDAQGQCLRVGPLRVVISDAALTPELLTPQLRHALGETTLDAVLHYDRGEITLLWPEWEDDHGVLDRGLAVIRAFRGAVSAYRS
jgi:hypothetical protein